MINYSIIVPHKDCLELLSRCIASIPSRKDIEVIVVDDGSDIEDVEDKIKIMGQFLNMHVCCHVLSKGAGAARNVGLNYARGNWLLFADADDFFSDGAFEILDDYISSDYDIIYFGHSAVYSDSLLPAERLGERMKYINEYVESKSSKSEDFLRYLNHSPTSKLIKRELVSANKIKFDEVPASNDAMFSVLTAYHAESIHVDKRVIYVTTLREGSITQTRSRENTFSRYSVELRLYDFYRSHGLNRMLPFLTMRVVRAFIQYGFSEGCRYLKLARQYKVNLLLGLTRRFNRKYRY